jgi:hypothetical protein
MTCPNIKSDFNESSLSGVMVYCLGIGQRSILLFSVIQYSTEWHCGQFTGQLQHNIFIRLMPAGVRLFL